MSDLARLLIAATLFAVVYLMMSQHQPQPALPLVQADYEQCVRVKNNPLPPPRKGRSINNGAKVVDIA